MVQKQRKSMADILAAAVRKQLNTPAYDEAVESIERITTQAQNVRKQREEEASKKDKEEQKQDNEDTTTQQSILTPLPDTPPKKQRVRKAPKTDSAEVKKTTRPRKARRALLDESLKNFIPRKPKVLGDQQVQLYEWLKGQGGRVYATGAVVSYLTGIPLRSLRRILQRWEEIRVIEKQADACGTALVLLLDDAQAYGTKGPRTRVEASLTNNDGTPMSEELQHAKTLRMADSVPKNRTLTPVAYEEQYPLLAAAGFGLPQFKNAINAARQAGLETEPFWKYLTYAEYELEHECMVDARGEPVTNPQNWIFKCLRSGSYRVPKGYLSPLETQRRALEEELRVELEERRKLEALQAQQLELALEKETDRLAQLALETDDAFSRQVLERLPPFLHKLDRTSPIFLSGVRREIRAMLTAESPIHVSEERSEGTVCGSFSPPQKVSL